MNQLLRRFLIENNLGTRELDEVILRFNGVEERIYFKELNNNLENTEIIYNIIADIYSINSKKVTALSKEFKKQKINLGRAEKDLLEKYLNYRNEEDLDLFLNTIGKSREDIEFINKYVVDNRLEASQVFCDKWNSDTREKRIITLESLYWRLIHEAAQDRIISLRDIFEYNREFINRDLEANLITNEFVERLENECNNNITGTLNDLTKRFNDLYMRLLKIELQEKSINRELEEIMNQQAVDGNIDEHSLIKDRGNDICLLKTEEYSQVHFNINQSLFNRFNNTEDFYDYLIYTVKNSYRILENNKLFSIKIENIYNEQNQNLKWDIYSKIGIYSERFIKKEETQNYYKTEDIFMDMIRDSKFTVAKENINAIKSYYKNKLTYEELLQEININENIDEFRTFLDSFKYVYMGFSFTDCFILNRNENYNNPGIEFIDNTTELLLTFYKHRIDQRRIPCPECAGLNISGNSFPEIGHRSWECKNEICPSRSKSNRGKRYSKKTNYMQWGTLDNSEENIVSRDMIAQWRRDIVNLNTEEELLEMLIKYYTFPNEKVLFINIDELPASFENRLNRNITLLSSNLVEVEDRYISNIDLDELNIKGLYREYFFEGEYISKFISKKQDTQNNDTRNRLNDFLHNNPLTSKLIWGESYNTLLNIDENTITSAVTSPPYYNAREYSQWPNLYLYLKDMYNIIREAYRVLRPGGIFLFNIGDIVNNENTIVKSKMGDKRILLGAYSILLFQKAGFEIIENIIWDKGETQSNRHKNDGKYTPHYQRPLNCYEHMFIFKKGGNDLILNDNFEEKLGIWNKNIVEFSPVIKINSRGENNYGHTAPFPKDIPDFVAKVFNSEENDILLDPFSGSLTSVLAAAENNIVGLGIEFTREYVELSIQRAQEENREVEVLDLGSNNNNIYDEVALTMLDEE